MLEVVSITLNAPSITDLCSNPQCPTSSSPVIIGSGNYEISKVAEVRDIAANDYPIKLFPAMPLHTSLVNTIEQPSPFVSSPIRNGPCRRRKNIGTLPGMTGRRRYQEDNLN